MFTIGQVSHKTGVSDKTIRYYESIGLLPRTRRAENAYRLFDESDVERLQFIRRARSLDFTLADIAEILAFKDRNEPPCRHVMNLMREQMDEISARIRDLERLRDELETLHEAGQLLPEDVQMRACVCHLIQTGVPAAKTQPDSAPSPS